MDFNKINNGVRKRRIYKVPFFHELPRNLVESLRRSFEVLRYSPGEIIFHEGDRSEYLWILRQGRVVLKRKSIDGHEVILDLLTPEEGLFGVSSLDGSPYAATAVAGSSCSLYRVPAEGVRKWMKSYPSIATALFSFVIKRLRHMESSISLYHNSASQRLLQILFSLSKKFGKKIPVTHKELASMAGTTVETSIRTLSVLRSRGILKIHRGEMTVLSPIQLRKIIQKYDKNHIE